MQEELGGRDLYEPEVAKKLGPNSFFWRQQDYYTHELTVAMVASVRHAQNPVDHYAGSRGSGSPMPISVARKFVGDE